MNLNENITLDRADGLTTVEPFEVYQTNALMRLVRCYPFSHRLRYAKELWQLTSKASASSGRRKHAIVALVGGDRLYRKLERRAMRAR